MKNRLVHETFHGAAEGLNRSHRAAWRGEWFCSDLRPRCAPRCSGYVWPGQQTSTWASFWRGTKNFKVPIVQTVSQWVNQKWMEYIRMYNGCTRIGIADRWKITPHKTNIATEKKMVIEPLKWSLFRGHLNFLGEGLLRSIRRGFPENLRSPGFTQRCWSNNHGSLQEACNSRQFIHQNPICEFSIDHVPVSKHVELHYIYKFIIIYIYIIYAMLPCLPASVFISHPKKQSNHPTSPLKTKATF